MCVHCALHDMSPVKLPARTDEYILLRKNKIMYFNVVIK